MSQTGRSQRVAELIREEIAKLIMHGLKDPRIGFVSVMGVRMSSDLRYANVYVSLYGAESEKKGSLAGLQHSSGWIRREIGKFLRMRYTPEIRFFPDDSLDEVYHLEQVFQEIHEDQKHTPMIKLDLPGVLSDVAGASSILLTTHENPDGDAVGSLLGMYHLLKLMGKERVACVMTDPVPRLYRNLPGAKQIKAPGAKQPNFEVAVLVDVSSLERVGTVAPWLENRKIRVIDHHLEEGQHGASGYIDPSYAASGEIVADMFALAGVPLTPEAAHCLYVAQITDTGGYRFSNTNARSHRIAATLLETGLDVATISSDVFEVISKPKFELLHRVIDRMQLLAEGRLAWSYVTARDLSDAQAKKEDTDGLVNYARNIEGVEVGVLFNAVEPSLTKVSLRSRKNFNSAEFLNAYGGGGHAAAAGATIEKSMEEVQREIIGQLEILLEGSAEGMA
ncbi:MAG TPA: 30S ribosome-binding factor RbfA [Candidatus Hydrogenedentes bacterium]|nr:30S ribosome-binding factor RbfA [Candidatus Hydrogenedentota bacterium]